MLGRLLHCKHYCTTGIKTYDPTRNKIITDHSKTISNNYGHNCNGPPCTPPGTRTTPTSALSNHLPVADFAQGSSTGKTSGPILYRPELSAEPLMGSPHARHTGCHLDAPPIKEPSLPPLSNHLPEADFTQWERPFALAFLEHPAVHRSMPDGDPNDLPTTL